MVSLKKSTPITSQVYPITPKKHPIHPQSLSKSIQLLPKNIQSTPKKRPQFLGKNTHGKDKNFYPYLHHGSYYILLKSL